MHSNNEQIGTSMNPSDPQSCPFAHLAWSAVVGLALAIAIAVAGACVQKPDMLYMENGPMENMSIALWLCSAFAAAAAYRRWPAREDRLTSFWVALFSCIAMLREADFHTLIHPNTLGRYGIRLRIDWVLAPQTGIGLKLACVLFFLVLVACVAGPMLYLRSRLWRLTRAGDAGIGMLIVGFAGLGLGYVMDELFRNSPLFSKAARVLTEESGEMLGALAFLAGSLLLCKIPVSVRLARAERGNLSGGRHPSREVSS